MAREVKVEFVGNARKLTESALEAVAALEGVKAGAVVSEDGMWAASASATGLGDQLKGLSSVSQYIVPVLIGLAGVIAFALTPAITFLVGELGALALGTLPLLALGGLAVIFTQLEIQTGRWASSTKELDAANQSLTAATKAHEQALRTLKEAQDGLAPGQKLSQVQLDHMQDLNKKVAETGLAVAAATDAQTAALKKADNPYLTLRTHLEAVANEVAARVEPALQGLFDWLDRLVPAGQTFADRAVDWFSVTLPGALHEMQGVFGAVSLTVEGIIGDIGRAFDDQLGHPKSFQDAVEVAFNQVRGAINWVLTELATLSAWWESDGKRFAADAQFDITILAAAFDWTAHAISDVAAAAHDFGMAFDAIGTTIHNVIGEVEAVIGAIQRLQSAINSIPFVGGALQQIGSTLHVPGLQHGGMAEAGSWFMSGEAGPELGYALPGGGVSIFPHGGGGGGGGGGQSPVYNYTVNVSVPVGAHPAAVGQTIVAAIQEYERSSSAAWRK